MGIRFWSMFRFPVDTQDIGGQLRRRTEATGQRSIRIDLNMMDRYQGRYGESSLSNTLTPRASLQTAKDRISIVVLIGKKLMNLVNIAGVLASIAFVWSAVMLTFCHIGWMAPEFSAAWQALMFGVTVGITGIICYLACVPFILVDCTKKKRKDNL